MYTSPREILNRLKWKEGEHLSEAVIHYISRGSPDDSAIARGYEIENVEAFGFELSSKTIIPWHRVHKIEYRGKIIFDKKWFTEVDYYGRQ